ncbi:hypothetical protein EJ05DRAFT_306996 [Pseudovirgaria hyperparasitica]|uniref:AHC1-like C2H2 zinc-finger domain-containing protein n=1 Tax=Pseudovirgaria hyperparasitica TaxID=470096 RepID=A0A6A6WF11_9PEZI|nr:uncharacterized protein EJ05DRAFT_306996 [Pseudovirgaria hyperparasitica]KAF2759701.1 hypothetical protein EJ05DRAFT_306996 [Pseudovirgaria hyperparasitica]
MQSMSGMFRLPWATEPQPHELCEKIQLSKPRQFPIPTANFKRKRTDSVDLLDSVAVQKRAKVTPREVLPTTATPTTSVTDPVPASQVLPGPVAEQKKDLPLQHGNVNPRPTPSPDAGKETAVDSVARAPSSLPPVAENTHVVQPSDTADMEACLTPLQVSIETQFNLEILFKHQELRLIDQELAKAQIALEQLRRCHIIPFPGSDGMSENVTIGAGQALRPAPGHSQPAHPAAWGVTDGPYTRHYAKWLIPDPKFDSVPLSSLSNGWEGRKATRAHFDPLNGSKSRTSRNSTFGLNLPSIGGEPAKDVPKVDPLLHKRSSDGKWVRLFCNDCGHSNFSNTQGFLNHCRIKHQLVFKSHDAAACQLGRPVDDQEAGAAQPTPTAVQSTPLPTPTNATTATPITAYSSAPRPFVHSLITKTPAQIITKSLPPRRLTEASPVELPRADTAGKVNALMTPTLTPGVKRNDYFSTPVLASPVNKLSDGSSFIPSPQTPFLNTLFEKRGVSGNLRDAVAAAKTKVDLSAIEMPSDDELGSAPHSPNHKTSESQPMARLPSRGGMGPLSQRQTSKKAHSSESTRPAHRAPTALNLNATPSLENSNSRPVSQSPVGLSPHTLESNPGLVSDDDDEDDEDDNCSVSQIDRDVDMMQAHHPVVVDDGSDAECERRKGIQGFKKAGPSQKQ